jgi:phosphoenolpyruvate-protein phosphotransferase (PTS system enzyme I)
MKGTGVSPGISIGKAFILKKNIVVPSGRIIESEAEIKQEINDFDKAVSEAINEVRKIISINKFNYKPEDIAILETQTEFIGDPQIMTDVHDMISNEKKSAIDAVSDAVGAMVQLFRNIDDEYLRARTPDIQDAGNRIIKHLLKRDDTPPIEYPENTIIIAEDITPTEAIILDPVKIAGIATLEGSITSHAAIIARSRGIPAVAGCSEELMKINNNDRVIIDGSTGDIIVDPDPETLNLFMEKKKVFEEHTRLLRSLQDTPAITKDGRRIRLFGNISGPDDMEQLLENGGEGVGLLRTEILFMMSDSFPSEEKQYQFYRQIATKAGSNPVIIRTLDIGGDKQLPYFKIPDEQNPFMGYRAIRISLDRKDVFLTQVKAILRASVSGNLKIMLPMICNVDEVKEAKELIRMAKQELDNSGLKYNPGIELGIMIEIPSAAMIVDMLSAEVDFFSIGTNDLCQYTMAVDRMNKKVSSLYDHFNPGLLRLIHSIIEQAHIHNKKVGMCGEMASDHFATLLLLGMGLDEYSMSSSSIPGIKKIITDNTFTKANEVFSIVMTLDSPEKIRKYLQETLK